MLVVKSIHISKDSLKKGQKIQIKFSELDFLTRYSVLFLCYLKQISFLGYLQLILFLCICSYVIWYQIILSSYKKPS